MVSEDDAGILFNVVLFEKFFKRHYSEFCMLASRYLNDRDAAEEVVQEVFVKIWEKRSFIEVKGSLTAYFNMAIKNTCLNYLKHKQIEFDFARNFVQQKKEDALSEEGFDEELVEKIRKAIDLLPPQRKKIFCMSRYDGLKYHEIAHRLQLSIKTVEAQMGLALKQLRDQLRDYLE
jgi:RNA polymerase sigma-70 factor (ECF subfamily)